MCRPLLLLVAALANAQTPKLAFEVVSVKPTKETPMSLFRAGKEIMPIKLQAPTEYRKTGTKSTPNFHLAPPRNRFLKCSRRCWPIALECLSITKKRCGRYSS